MIFIINLTLSHGQTLNHNTSAKIPKTNHFIKNNGGIFNQKGHTNKQVLYQWINNNFQTQITNKGHNLQVMTKVNNNKYITNRVDVIYEIDDPKSQIFETTFTNSLSPKITHNSHKNTQLQQVNRIYNQALIEYKVYNDQFKYNLIFNTITAFKNFRMTYKGHSKLYTENNELIIETPIATIHEKIPYAYWLKNEVKTPVEITYYVNQNTVEFKADTLIENAQLIIDPTFLHTLKYGSYFGGKDEDESYSVTSDSSANIYITGKTNSTANVATTGSHQDTLGGSTDAFVAKFSPELDKLLWATYFGGADEDIGFDIALDNKMCVYITGVTKSDSGFATSGAHQNKLGSSNTRDAFLAKFTTNGQLLWTTYYGGSDEDFGYSVDVSKNRVAITGATKSTNSTSIATSSSHQKSHGGSTGYNDGFLAVFDTTGSRKWATYYGGDEEDVAKCVTFDQNNNIYIAGYTESDNNTITTSGAHQTALGGRYDAFLAKFNSSGTRQWGSYYGGKKDEITEGLTFQNGGKIFMVGLTESTNAIATTGAHQTSKGSGSDADAFICSFNGSGKMQWGSYLGGSGEDIAYDVFTDKDKNVVLSGKTKSGTGIASTGAYQGTHAGTGYYDAFIAKFNNNGSALWKTYFGSTLEDISYAVNTDKDGFIIISGLTRGTSGIATSGAFNTS
ncbi:MAG: SBBP repeat-containing protein, partial [Bacteroidia bacterium]